MIIKTSALKREARKLIPQLTAAGLRIAVVKHSHHDFSIDQPGKDSYELHRAGSQQTLIASSYRTALVSENLSRQEPELSSTIQQLDLEHTDLVLVEGFRHQAGLKKIELHRRELDKPLLFKDDPDIIALAINDPEKTDPSDGRVTILDLNQPQQLATLILEELGKKTFSFPLKDSD